MTATFTCAICGEKMTTQTDKTPEYCPFCGACKRLIRSRKSLYRAMPVETRLQEYAAALEKYTAEYKQLCLSYGDLLRHYRVLRQAVARGTLPPEQAPKMPRFSLQKDYRYYMDLEESKDNHE